MSPMPVFLRLKDGFRQWLKNMPSEKQKDFKIGAHMSLKPTFLDSLVQKTFIFYGKQTRLGWEKWILVRLQGNIWHPKLRHIGFQDEIEWS